MTLKEKVARDLKNGIVGGCYNPKDIQTLLDQIDHLLLSVSFLSSVVKSGESWTKTCEEMVKNAKA